MNNQQAETINELSIKLESLYDDLYAELAKIERSNPACRSSLVSTATEIQYEIDATLDRINEIETTENLPIEEINTKEKTYEETGIPV